MTKTAIALAMVMMSCVGSAVAQANAPATTTPAVLNKSLSDVEGEFVPAADAMPEAQYTFAPSEAMGDFKGVRTYADQVNHVAAVNYIVGAAILGEKPPVALTGEGAPANVKTKADSIKFLKDSFAYAHKAIDSLTNDNVFGLVQLPWGPEKTTRASLAITMVSHPWDHYGQMVEYLRMNKIIPPASRK